MKYIAIFLITIYQKTISFDHGLLGKIVPHYRPCWFQPSCSEYTKQAIRRYGFFKGTWLGSKRIVRCGPWAWDKARWVTATAATLPTENIRRSMVGSLLLCDPVPPDPRVGYRNMQ